jgi:hypothetical protein
MPLHSLHSQYITAERPLMLGLLIDVSGSMRSLILGATGQPEGQRIESVRESMNKMIKRAVELCTTGVGAEVSPKVKIFAYGFGFGNPLSPFLGWKGASVEDLLAIPGEEESLLSIDQLAREWPRYQQHIKSLGRHMFGATPMLEAFQVAQHRIAQESDRRQWSQQPILFVLSDGEPTRGADQICAIAQELKDSGVLIMGLHVGAGLCSRLITERDRRLVTLRGGRRVVRVVA